ncbi:MAG: energy-coupling factor ABC transporter ATP-binding protein [Spirochaetaceae bacterium]|jgi:cobalt/nickel transport system ATP-binding protein|nr:energy-coupling factor ABC transporter ATP-binding protein [Spirochaetaceae bacterium]
MEHIRLTNISFSYENHAPPVLADISFSVEQGRTLCVAGANGCGKSTLLQIIAGALKPISGNVTIFDIHGGEVSPLAPARRRRSSATPLNGGAAPVTPPLARQTGIVFQNVDHQLFMPTVWEDVAFGILKKGIAPEAAREAALAALAMVDAEHLAEKPPHKLSGGEKQRAALAGILITEPEILVLDEPTSSLDPRARKNLIALLRSLPRTKIIATHDLDLMLDLADGVLFLNNGKIAAPLERLPPEALPPEALPPEGLPRPPSALLTDEPFLQSIGLELPLSLARGIKT